MGDPARFRLFADAIGRSFPDRSLAIADVAGGKGGLRAALSRLGYGDVVSWDVRHRNAKCRRHVHYGLFDHRSAPRAYGLVVGMHPDQATDHIILYAIRHRRPFAVVPCCVMPSGAGYGGARADFVGWTRHLANLAREGRMDVTLTSLPMRGRNLVIAGCPRARR